MLHCASVVPEGFGEGGVALVLLHGRGADERDLLELGSALAPSAAVVSPRAPFPGAQWGYGPGWAWYRYLGRNRPEPESFEASQQALAELLERLPAVLGARPGVVVLGGFSQGGTMSVAHALRRGAGAPPVLNFSGFLADHPSVRVERDSARGLEVWWGHGEQDANIPHALAVEGRAALVEAGVSVEGRDYPIGHWIAPEEVEDAAAWVGRVAASAV
jgi:phospholipase/carboxylesterase